MLYKYNLNKTIAALATPPGIGGIGIIRVAGEKAVEIVNPLFTGKDLSKQQGNTIHFGKIVSGDKILDEVLVSIFKAPHSYTGDDIVEISCHGSSFIQETILKTLLDAGCALARPGEFTQRAFLNGKMDLAQAEAVADLIAANSSASHQLALQQMRGGFSSEIMQLRERLIWFASLIELELDFSQEDVEFADRTKLQQLLAEMQLKIGSLLKSFQLGNAIKEGVPVAIVGKPNSGKSTLLNTLVNEERAIVSDIAGTTRDTIEEILNINGILFRLIDTAGIRQTDNVIEQIGVEKALEKIEQAQLVIYVFDSSVTEEEELKVEVENLKIQPEKLILVANKIDLDSEDANLTIKNLHMLKISALKKSGVNELKEFLYTSVTKDKLGNESSVVSNQRHYQNLKTTSNILANVQVGIEHNLQSDLLAANIRYALQSLGEITGQITNEDLLDTIFSKFCIGK